MKINVDFSQLPSEADRERQAEWRRQGVKRIKALRVKRVAFLDRERSALTRATQAYRSHDRGDVPSVVLHNRFIALDSPRPGPPSEESETVEPQELSD